MAKLGQLYSVDGVPLWNDAIRRLVRSAQIPLNDDMLRRSGRPVSDARADFEAALPRGKDA